MRVPSSELGGSIIPFRSGTVLYSKLRPNLNKVVLADEDGYATSELLPMIADECRLRKEYLAAFLRSKPFVKGACECVAGAKMPRISRRDVLAARIPLPSLRVQQELCDLLTLLHELLMVSNQWTVKLDALVKSRFVEMFVDCGFPMVPFGDCCVRINNGMTRRGNDEGGSIVLRLVELQKGYVDYSSVNRIMLTEKERSRFLLFDGDILFARVNGNPDNVGRCAAFRSIGENVYHNDHVIRVTVKASLFAPEYLVGFMNSPNGRKQIRKNLKTSAGQYTINQDGIKAICLPLPPLSLQQEFADFVAQVDKSRFVVQLLMGKYNGAMTAIEKFITR